MIFLLVCREKCVFLHRQSSGSLDGERGGREQVPTVVLRPPEDWQYIKKKTLKRVLSAAYESSKFENVSPHLKQSRRLMVCIRMGIL